LLGLQPSAQAHDLPTGANAQETRAILAIGTVTGTSNISLPNWYVVPGLRPESLVPGPYLFEYQDAQGSILLQQSFDPTTSFDGTPIEGVPFLLTIPYVDNTARILIRHNGVEIGQRTLSANAPVVSITGLTGGERYMTSVPIRWTASDSDQDALSYAVLASADNGLTWDTLVMDLSQPSYDWNVQGVPAGSAYRIKVIATDGFNTGESISAGTFSISQPLFIPLIRR